MSDFFSRHKQEWDELAWLIKTARRSVRRLSAEDRQRLDVLYRRATVHLAQVRTRTSDESLARYLNSLTAAAHSLIYLPPREPALRGLLWFMISGFARTIARQWRFHLLSAALVLGGALLAFFAGRRDPLAIYALMPAGDPRAPGATQEQLLEILRSGRDTTDGGKFLFASFLFGHNLKVGLLALALGVLAAIPTALLTFYNGMMLGAFVAVHHQAGITTEMWAWILPHGVTEIGAIILCGGTGLQLGWAVVCPRMRTRSEALKRVAPEIGRTVGGAGLMLCFAAIIESYLRQSHLSTSARLVFAGGTIVFWIAYITSGVLSERRMASKSGCADAVR